ncbi:MAG: hypothetical protein K9J77_01460 [Rhodoferax sp.]|nr:hypothetical protein [Rhodoferax sp.]
MNMARAIQLGLEDLLADLQHARRENQLGRLALLTYCEVRNWARRAGKHDIADGATRMFTENPCVSKEEFLAKVDTVIATLEQCLQDSRSSEKPEVYAAVSLDHLLNTPRVQAGDLSTARML